MAPARGGGDLRALGLVESAARAGHDVLVVQADESPASAFPDGVRVESLGQHGGFRRVVGKLMPPSIVRSPVVSRDALRRAENVLADFDPHVAVVSEILSWSFAARLVRGVPYVYDAHNVESDLFRSLLESPGTAWPQKVLFRLDQNRVRKAEQELLRNAGAVLSVSDAEADRHRQLGAAGPVLTLPNSVPSQKRPVDPAAAPPEILFVGTLRYPPNIDAVETLVRDVMPRVVARVPNARLHIVGRRPTAAVEALVASAPWARLSADLPELADAYAGARCAVIPMRSGAGTNVKVYEALSYGLPTIGTSKAFEGIEVRPGADVLASDSIDDLAASAADVLLDDDRAREVGRAGYAAFETRLSWSAAGGPVLNQALHLVAREASGEVT